MRKSDEQFIESYNKFADAIFRHCYFRVSDRDLANDLVQETFIRTWNYIAKGNDIKNIRAFLYRVATNLIISEYRKRKPVSLDAMKEKGFDVRLDNREDMQVSVEVKEILQVLDKMRSKYREVITMRYIDELFPREIAEILNTTENVVSVRIHRGLKELKKILSHE